MDPEAYLDSLEPIGWKLGLERMHRLSALLGLPQHRFASIHVVGTNGKSSVARMIAALLEAHGVSAGACVSPHAERWSERVLVHGDELGAAEFAAAVERAAQAADIVNRSSGEAERSDRRDLTVRERSSAEAIGPVTQFELATAAAFVALATAGVQAAAIEAGLGGRLDATNTIPSRVTVLTSVGLDHTQWLGGTEEEIAAEKLAVLRDQTTLVLGRVAPAVRALGERSARERGARLLVAPEDPGPKVRLRAAGRFQRRNFALACAAAEAFLGELDPERAASVAAGIEIPGRLERVAQRSARLPRRRPQPRRRRGAGRGLTRNRARSPARSTFGSHSEPKVDRASRRWWPAWRCYVTRTPARWSAPSPRLSPMSSALSCPASPPMGTFPPYAVGKVPIGGGLVLRSWLRSARRLGWRQRPWRTSEGRSRVGARSLPGRAGSCS